MRAAPGSIVVPEATEVTCRHLLNGMPGFRNPGHLLRCQTCLAPTPRKAQHSARHAERIAQGTANRLRLGATVTQISGHNGVVSSTSAAMTAPHVSVNRPNIVSVGVIVWLASELMFFAGLFAMYFTHRAVSPEIWPEHTEMLNVPFALGNTTVLVLSSVTAQLGVFQAEKYRQRRTGSLFNVAGWGMEEWFTLTFIMGAIFVSGQIFEYAELISHGLTISSSPYGSVFYITTGFHALHVIGGLIGFLYILGRSFAAKRFGNLEATGAVVVSYYWHFVDVVWIALFIIIYFLR